MTKYGCIIAAIVLLLSCGGGIQARPASDAEQFNALMTRGKSLFEKGDYAPAADAYTKASALDPDNPDAHNALGMVFIRQGKLGQAQAEISRALALKKDYPEFLANKGLIFIKMKKYEEAETVLKKAVEKDHDLYFGHIRLAMVCLELKKYELGLDYARRASELNLESYQPYKIQAEIYTAQQKYDKAVEAYLVAEDKDEDNFDLYLACGKVSLQLGDKKRAKKQYREAIDLRESDHDLRMELGNIYKEDGQYEYASDQFLYVYKRGPKNSRPEAAYAASVALFEDAMVEDAEKYGRIAVDLKPGEMKYREHLSRVYEKQKKYDEAAEILPAAGNLKDPNEFLTLGNKHEQAGNLQQAALYYSQGKAANPGIGMFYLKLGLVYTMIEEARDEDKRDFTAARQVYEEAFAKQLEDEPEAGKIAYNLAKLHALQQDHKAALRNYMRAVRCQPTMVKAYVAVVVSYVATRPWTEPVHVAVWVVVFMLLFGLYFMRRRKIKRKLAEQMEQERKSNETV